MLDIAAIKSPCVAQFEQKIPGMFAALVQHETLALQDVIASYTRGRRGDVPVDVGTEIDLASLIAIAVPVIANCVIVSGVTDREASATALIEAIHEALQARIPLIVAKVTAAVNLAQGQIVAHFDKPHG